MFGKKSPGSAPPPPQTASQNKLQSVPSSAEISSTESEVTQKPAVIPAIPSSGTPPQRPATPPTAAPAPAATPFKPAAVKPLSDSPAATPAPASNVPAVSQKTVAPSSGGALPAVQQKASASAHSDSGPRMTFTDAKLENADFIKAKTALIETLLEEIDFAELDKLDKDARRAKISETADKLIQSINVPLTAAQQTLLRSTLLNEVLGFGPLEALMADADVSDIMINGPKQVYIEKNGKLYLSDIVFNSEKHLLNVVQKIVSLVGRRVDETSPMVDARMPDGSRFNAIIPPLALNGSLVSIRKFKKNKMPLRKYLDYQSMSMEMCQFLEIAGNIRLNIIISGGTGSGKTTLLNAISGHIDNGERVITIEDAAELQLQQPHVLRLETRPSNIEGHGEINQRHLVKNALRMRPDRIILGEIRGEEIIDVLAAMNTGHDGSMATIHSNNPRDCLSRMENLILMSGVSIPIQAMRQQIASAVHLIVQVARMRDGGRRITHIEEIVGLEKDVIVTQTLFGYQTGPMGPDGKLTGKYYGTGVRPRFIEQAAYFNRDKELMDCVMAGAKQQ
jgi:pilus assembly protein CpaF